MGSKFRLNRYNWFGQKLLAQHKYGEIQRLYQHLTRSSGALAIEGQQEALVKANGRNNNKNNSESFSAIGSFGGPVSEHLSYIYGLALMKTSTRLDEIIFSLQRLNFDKNSQYFLLLCQCLLYLGNYDSVVALCKQVIDKEIDSVVGSADNDQLSARQEHSSRTTTTTTTSEDYDTIDLINLNLDSNSSSTSSQETRAESSNKASRQRLCLEESIGRQESSEFKRVFANINRNQLINEPRLWFIFGLCLEYQRQLKDAYFAYKVASKLSSGNILANKQLVLDTDGQQQQQQAGQQNFFLPTTGGGGGGSTFASTNGDGDSQSSISNYYAPHTKYAELSIKLKDDYKTAIQALAQASLMFPHNYTLNPMLALAISAQPVASNYGANSNKAIKLISSLENYTISNRNPSLGYNRLALKASVNNQSSPNNYIKSLDCQLLETGDENRSNLNYLLIKGHIVLNSCFDSCSMQQQQQHHHHHQAHGNHHSHKQSSNAPCSSLVTQADRLIEALRESDSACWASASLWNNLGVCYLIKRRFIACLSCLMKAYNLNPLDWRINYNLSVACMQVGLVARALICLFAAKNLYASSSSLNNRPSNFSQQQQQQQQQQLISVKQASGQLRTDPTITTLLAICYEKLGEVDESRRLFIGTTRFRKGSASSVPVNSLVNYLIFLHNNPDRDDEQHVKLKLHLLDQLEQSWLQRNLNDHQFKNNLLAIASRIGDEIFTNQSQATRKTYAWTKADPFADDQ